MAINSTQVFDASSIANGNSFTIDGSESGTGSVIITEMGGSGSADIYRETDATNDGTYAVSVKMDSLTGDWHTQLNNIVVSANNGVRLRITNTSGGSAAYFAVGKETDN